MNERVRVETMLRIVETLSNERDESYRDGLVEAILAYGAERARAERVACLADIKAICRARGIGIEAIHENDVLRARREGSRDNN